MIYYLVTSNIIDYSIYLLVLVMLTFGVSFASLVLFRRVLPKDQGRQFAVNGALSEGKPRGAGLIFITTFVLCVALIVPLDVEKIIYLVCVYGAMLTGYLDDGAKKPWGNLKKGLFDLAIALGVSITYYLYNGSDINILLTDTTLHIPAVLFVILEIVLIWASINVTNCSDGVDGLCASLVMCVLASLCFLPMESKGDKALVVIMFVTLCSYLWFNCSPSKMLMGDAGSRALGVFLAVMFLKTSAPVAFIPLAIVIILDGGLGLLKLSFRRFLKMKNFMESIRTPLHDHARKNKGWSDTQVVIRFVIIQILVCLCYVYLVRN